MRKVVTPAVKKWAEGPCQCVPCKRQRVLGRGNNTVHDSFHRLVAQLALKGRSLVKRGPSPFKVAAS